MPNSPISACAIRDDPHCSAAVPDLGRHGRLGRRQVHVQRGRPAPDGPALSTFSIPPIPPSSSTILADIDAPIAAPARAGAEAHAGGRHGHGMTSYEPVVNLEKLATLYERHKIDSAAELPLHDAAGLAAGSVRRRRAATAASSSNSTATTPPPDGTAAADARQPVSAGLVRGWICAAGSTRHVLSARSRLHTAWKLSAFLHTQGLAGRDKITLLLPKVWAGAALWTKQDFEESLGKSEEHRHQDRDRREGRSCRTSARPRIRAQDRCFWPFRSKGRPNPEAQKITLPAARRLSGGGADPAARRAAVAPTCSSSTTRSSASAGCAR